MNKHFILIENIEGSKIEKILFQFVELYSNEDFVHGISLFRKKDSFDSFALTFDNEPDFMQFAFAVNYIQCPEDIEVNNLFVKGYYHTGKIMYKFPFVKGEYLMMYVSKLNNKVCDNVDVINEQNRVYRYSFEDSYYPLKTIEHRFEPKEFDETAYHHVIDIFPEKASRKMEVKKWWKFW